MMRRLLLIVIVMLATRATADANNTDFISQKELFDIALTGDVEKIEDIFRDTHRKVTNGELTPDHIRILNSMMINTHPDILAVSQEWLAEMPNSIYAKTLVAFQYSAASWRVRGPYAYNNTYSEAIDQFNRLREHAFDLAYSTYETAPEYLPASDAVLVFSGTQKVLWESEIDTIIADTLAVTPNFGTLIRASGRHLPQWGGAGAAGVLKDCERYGSLIPSIAAYTAMECMAIIVINGNFPTEQKEIAAETLIDFERENTETEVMWATILRNDKGRAWQIKDYFGSRDRLLVSDIALADAYAAMVLSPDGYQVQLDAYLLAAEQARAWLEFDPFNAAAIAMVESAPSLSAEPIDAEIDRANRFDLAARGVAASPFAPLEWVELGGLVSFHEGFAESQAAFANAISYGLHREHVTSRYLDSLAMIPVNLKIKLTNGSITQEVADKMMEPVICEAVRIHRLNEHLCQSDSTYYQTECNPFYEIAEHNNWVDQNSADFMSMARSQTDICDKQRFASLEETIFHPVPVDLTQYLALKYYGWKDDQ